MIRKDYVLIARAIGDLPESKETIINTAWRFADALARTRADFNRDKFLMEVLKVHAESIALINSAIDEVSRHA